MGFAVNDVDGGDGAEGAGGGHGARRSGLPRIVRLTALSNFGSLIKLGHKSADVLAQHCRCGECAC